jgi:phosphoribosylformylglycinamidine cyclo-ligase
MQLSSRNKRVINVTKSSLLEKATVLAATNLDSTVRGTILNKKLCTAAVIGSHACEHLTTHQNQTYNPSFLYFPFLRSGMAKVTYKDAGIDLAVYRESMSRLPRLSRRTYSPRVLPLEGGFAGLFQLDFDSPLFARRYQNPVLVGSTDGVGTKLKVATLCGVHHSVGIDLVAMSVNDTLCCGAEPLFFLDYVAMSHDDPDLLEQIVEGVAAGCLESDCALLGGETAIMPDLYARGDYDLAGFCVGVVERRRLIDGSQIAPDDVVLGIASSGLHSNGFSLVRKIVFDVAGFSVNDHVDELGATVGDALLTPTRIYARPLRSILNHYKVKNVVHGIAHITGGGLRENLCRIVPEGIQLRLQRESWRVPPVFRWLQRLGEVSDDEMEMVFNLGVGLVLVVSPFFADSIRKQLAELGLENWPIGRAVSGPRGVVWSK